MLENSKRDSASKSRKSFPKFSGSQYPFGIRSSSQSRIPNDFEVPRTSPDSLMTYGFVADKVLEKWAVLTYLGDPVVEPIYPDCEVILPHSAMCLKTDGVTDKHESLRPVQPSSYSEEDLFYNYQGEGNGNTEDIGDEYDEINRWIESLPIFEANDNEWKSYCYYTDYSQDWEAVSVGDEINELVSVPGN